MLKSMLFIATSAFIGAALPVQAAESCDMYFVQKGDTLRLIAEHYYGSRDLSPLIYNANAATVGDDPNNIEIGMALDIPCREGINLPASTSFLNINHTPPPANGHFLARSGAYPFVDTKNAGIVARILFAALRQGGYTAPFTTLQPENTVSLLQSAAAPEALLSFPWIKPDCEAGARLSADIADLCANYTLSKPLYEITLGLFTTKDSPLGLSPSRQILESSRICFAEFYDNSLLDTIGLTTNAALATAPASRNADCVSGLLEGRYDAIVSDYQSIGALPAALSARLTDIPAYAHKTTLHAAAYHGSPAAQTALEQANRGLADILGTGEWFNIVNQGLALANGS